MQHPDSVATREGRSLEHSVNSTDSLSCQKETLSLFGEVTSLIGGDAECGDDQAAFFALDDRDVGQVAQRFET